jgi:LacI family transcriptional regulator, repressor for deo operon, udp, cdd, tsx, nupC, and nupG
MLAIVVSDVTNPVYFPLIRGAETSAAKLGYTLVLSDAQESAQTEREAIDRTLPLVEGVLLAGSRMSDAAIRHIAEQIPLVIANRAVPGVTSVVADSPRGMRRAVEHLALLGHEWIVYVSGPEASWANGTRWRAVQEAAHELELRVSRLGPYSPTVAGGMAAVEDLMRDDATALISYNDVLAIGILRGLASVGVRMPDEISVVGFDNIFGSDLCTPALTTVAAQLKALGEGAVTQLVAQARGAPARTGPPATLPTRLVVRESTARPGGQRNRKSVSPASGTTSGSGEAAQASGLTSSGSR